MAPDYKKIKDTQDIIAGIGSIKEEELCVPTFSMSERVYVEVVERKSSRIPFYTFSIKTQYEQNKQTKKNNTCDPRHFAKPVPSHVIPCHIHAAAIQNVISNDSFEPKYCFTFFKFLH